MFEKIREKIVADIEYARKCLEEISKEECPESYGYWQGQIIYMQHLIEYLL